MSKSAKSIIKDYLDEMAKKDESFAVAYGNSEKNLDACFAYIVSVAEKKKEKCVCMADEEVFGLAVHYYVEGDLKDVKLPASFESVGVSEDTGGAPEKVKAETKRKANVKKPKKDENVGMGYLFDF